jgi:hypothetical protein
MGLLEPVDNLPIAPQTRRKSFLQSSDPKGRRNMTPYWDLGPLFERFPLTVFGVSVGISFDSNALTVQRTEAVNGVLTHLRQGRCRTCQQDKSECDDRKFLTRRRRGQLSHPLATPVDAVEVWHLMSR